MSIHSFSSFPPLSLRLVRQWDDEDRDDDGRLSIAYFYTATSLWSGREPGARVYGTDGKQHRGPRLSHFNAPLRTHRPVPRINRSVKRVSARVYLVCPAMLRLLPYVSITYELLTFIFCTNG